MGNPHEDSTRWKQMQLAMNDSGRFVDMVRGVSWEDGLKPNLRTALESFLAKSETGELGVTQDGSVSEATTEVTSASKKADKKTASSSGGGITIKAASFASDEAGVLVQYVIAIVEYSKKCAPLQEAADKLKEIDKEVADIKKLMEQRKQEVSTIFFQESGQWGLFF